MEEFHLKITGIGTIEDIDKTKQEDGRKFLVLVKNVWEDMNIRIIQTTAQCFTTGASAGMDFLVIVFDAH